MNEADIIPAACVRVAARLADADAGAVGLEPHPAVAAAVTAMRTTLAALADALAIADLPEKIDP